MASDSGQADAPREGAAFLQTPSGDCIALRADGSYLLGRSPDCDIVVSDVASSRRHARITVGEGPDSVEVEDLESRNGTFVDDERIEEKTPLSEGSRLRIGATVYRVFHTETSASEDPSEIDTGTVALGKLSFGHKVDETLVRVMQSRSGSGSKMAGTLAAFDFVEVLGVLSGTGRSGTLHVQAKPGHGKVEFREGEIHSASIAELEGFHALVMLARQSKGKFWFVETVRPVLRSIREPTPALLLELCQTVDAKSTSRRWA